MRLFKIFFITISLYKTALSDKVSCEEESSLKHLYDPRLGKNIH